MISFARHMCAADRPSLVDMSRAISVALIAVAHMQPVGGSFDLMFEEQLIEIEIAPDEIIYLGACLPSRHIDVGSPAEHVL